MALQEQVVPISLGNGLDTKSDSKTVQAKVLQLVDAVFTNPGEIEKRNGYTLLPPNIDSSGSITNSLMLRSFNNELLCADGTNLYSYSPTLSNGTWVNKGSYQSVSVTEKEISSNKGGVNAPTMATNGPYTVSAYSDLNGNVYASLIDNSNQVFLIEDYLISSGGVDGPQATVQAVCLSGITLAVIYVNSGSNLEISTVTFGTNSAVFNAGTLVKAAVNASYPNISFSSDGTNNFVTVLASGSPGVFFSIEALSSTGSVIHTATPSGYTAEPGYIQAQVDNSGNVWVYFVDLTTLGSEKIYYTIYSSTLTLVLAPTSIVSGLGNISNISASNQINGNQYIYYSINLYGEITSTPNYVKTLYAVLSTTAVISSGNLFLTNVEVESKWASINGINYAVFGTIPGNVESISANGQVNIGNQKTYFLISESTKVAIAKCFSGSAVTGGLSVQQGSLSSLYSSGTSLIFGAAYIFYVETENSVAGLFNLPLGALSQVTFNFDDFEAYQSVIAGNSAILNGGIVQMYDGKKVSELGFSQYPENVWAFVNGTYGGLSTGNYTWAATYEWYDASGNFHVSSPQMTGVISCSSTNGASVQIQTIAITQKTGVTGIVITLYRTTVNGTIFYKVGQANNDPTVTFVTIIDAVSDAQIQAIADDQLYTDGGVVPNDAPPPAMILMTNQNRLWVVDSESPTNTIWYSKTYSPGNGIAMSELLQTVVDPRFGNITSLIGMDANTCVLKQNGLVLFTGDGADDTGQNSSITNPQVIPSDVGCLYSRGTVLTPDGVMFKSSKGIYLLGRGLSVGYFGADVEAFNSQNIESALIAPNTSQIRFLTSAGFTLVYDYIFKQWGQFSNHLGYSSTIWNNEYVYCRTDGSIFMENPTTFLDNATAYAPLVQIAWFKAGSIQGFQRIRKALLLGNHISPVAGHGVRISAAYDFVESFSTPVNSPTFPVSGSQAVYQYREFFKRQKCDSFSVLIQEVTTGASGEFVSFTDLSLNMGVKRGLNKVSAAQSVG